jgi:hypothetical protein
MPKPIIIRISFNFKLNYKWESYEFLCQNSITDFVWNFILDFDKIN